MSGGMNRSYRIHIPTGYDASTPAELLFVWHGYLENGAGVETVSQMTPLSDQNGFLLVYPEGIGNSFNAGKCCGTAVSSNIDDVGFFDDMLAKIESEYCVDQKRVFSSGYSNGAMMSQRLACERANVVAAIGPVAGPIDVDSCAPSRPVGVVEFHGTSDPVVFYGGSSPSGAQPVETTIANWEMYDSCTPPPAQVYQMGDATCTEEATCAGGSAVRFCKIQGGGHQWPGGMSGGALLGKVSTDISASQTMLDFFAAHPMP
jgi:polyhydroxybutyrate depolymerase